MNKQELITTINGRVKNSMTNADAERFVNAFLDTVKETVAKGETVQLVGFGTFESRQRAAREARNPLNGEKILIAAKKVPAFKPGKAFKDMLK